MSRSPTQAQNAASRAVVRPEQGPEPAPSANHHHARLRPNATRNSSTSLLSRLFLTAQEVTESHTLVERSCHSATTVARPDRTFQPGAEGKIAHDNSECPPSEPPMEATALSLKLAAPSLGDNPSSDTLPFDMSDQRRDNGQLMGHRELLNSKRGRGTSLERTLKEKRVQQPPASIFSNNPGDTGTINGPAPRSPTTRIPSSDDPSYDGVRANYRSWRDTVPPRKAAEKAWSIGEQTLGEVPGGQVEKSVVEALGGVEPNNRSRKASHSLRFFKEGLVDRSNKTGSGELDKIDDTRAAVRSQLVPIEASTDVRDRGNGVGVATNSRFHIEGAPNGLPSQSSHDAASEHQNFLSIAPKRLSQLGRTSMAESKQPQSSDETQQEAHPRTPSLEGTAHDRVTDKSGNEEDDESGEEQISSAVFVPHNIPRDTTDNKTQQLRDPREKDSAHQRTSISESEQWLEEHEVPPREIGENHAENFPVDEVPAHTVDHFLKQEQDDLSPSFPKSQSNHDVSYDTNSDTGYSTRDEESSLTDGGEITPTERREGRRYMTKNHKEHLHHHQQIAKPPLEAIELIPYRHQVGGHTTMWRFSRRAVCKQLNNRENEFYEKIERYHPQLLKFMPRYIGVLNVTFEKQQRRRTSTRDPAVPNENDSVSSGLIENGIGNGVRDKALLSNNLSNNIISTQPSRMISQSMNCAQIPAPTVTFADNRHIIPKSFQQTPIQPQEAARRAVSGSTKMETLASKQPSQAPLAHPNGLLKSRPTFVDKHAASWGATTVNKRLRNEVFGEAFLQQPVPIHRHKNPAQQRQSLHRSAYPTIPSHLRTSNSESNLVAAQQIQSGSTADPDPEKETTVDKVANGVGKDDDIRPTMPCDPAASTSILKSPPDSKPLSNDASGLQHESKAAASAPTAELLVDPKPTKKQRRYSSGGLRRKPGDDSEDRGDLRYFEEADDAGYKIDDEPKVFHMDPELPIAGALQSSTSEPARDPVLPARGSVQSSAPPDDYNHQGKKLPEASHEPLGELPPSTRPVNPKQAQTQRDKRVEFFLLLEDLTAGMRRPCIMDLKMGTRQYGVDANKKKQESQRHKCAETTSKELGVRVCGLQVWDVATESYIFKDKYFGRKLKAGRDFQDALTRFLYDGVDYASVLRHIPAILHKLSQLEVLIMDLRGYRFYAASLLMFYDGDVEDDGSITDASTTKEMKIRGREIDFKIADFANCVTAENGPGPVKEKACPPRHHDEPDMGFLCGLRSLRKYFVNIQNEALQKEKATGVDTGSVNGNGQLGDLSNEDLGNVSY